MILKIGKYRNKVAIIFFIIFLFQLCIFSVSSTIVLPSSPIEHHSYNPYLCDISEIKSNTYADLEIILFEVWWSSLSNGTLYVRYLVENKGDSYYDPVHPILLNISLEIDSVEHPIAYINQGSFIDPNTWYFTETLGGCIQIPLSEKPQVLHAQVNPSLTIPERNIDNNFLSTTVFHGIIIKGQVTKQDGNRLVPAINTYIKICNETSLQSRLYIRFMTNETGHYITALYPKQPLTMPHRYYLIFTDIETDYNLVLKTSPLAYNSTEIYNITFHGRPPNRPMKPIGLPFGFSNRSNLFFTITKDLDGDQFWFKIQYTRDDYSQWIGPYESFHPMFFLNMWSIPSIYPIRVIAKDTYGMLSPWSEIKIVNIL